ncbi:MAG: bifunctional diguanylate cyclase/phosphodiesterase [Clostridia bacterium]|nr:bifunctional diguanylate cyclase/phosphodiesterase [Clostridia bacterium]
MTITKAARNRHLGLSVKAFAFPLLIIVAILHIIIIVLIIDVNRSSTMLSELMKRSGEYQIDATSMQGTNTVLSETSANYIQRAGITPNDINVQPLSTYAKELDADTRSFRLLEKFRTYDVSEEVLSNFEQAAELCDQMTEVQLHAISLVRSVYPFPDIYPALKNIPNVELTEEEKNMSDEERVSLAKSMILDKDYAQLRYKISGFIDNCTRILQDEFNTASAEAQHHVSIVRLFLWISVFVIIAFLLITFIMFYQLILKPVRICSEKIDENKRIDEVRAIRELKILINSHNNLWSRRNKLESILRAEAETDSLTGLPNRFSMETNIMKNESFSGSLGVLWFDVNYLKITNDTKGHLAGDHLLKTSAACIKECFAENAGENCYRIGVDEFVVFLMNCTESDILKRIEAFNKALERENISVSVGYAFEENANDNCFHRLIDQADQMMYEQKKITHDNSKNDTAVIADMVLNENRYDSLTGLPSISFFFELSEPERDAILQNSGRPALLYFDLNGMKYYNHKYGFASGDNLLRSFADILARLFGRNFCSHVGADHFAVLTDEEGLEEKLNKLFDEWADMNKSTPIPVSVGIFRHWDKTISPGIAYDRSKLACDALKGTYSSSFKYYSDELNEAYLKKKYILENFDRALSENWIKVFYQPIVRIINKNVTDLEALARWDDPEKGFLSPADFIPYLEEAGLIYKLDLYVLDRVLEHMQEKDEEGLYLVPHSINLSRSDFDSCDIVDEITKRVDNAGINRRKICIEITESVIGRDFDFMKTQIDRFQQLGFHVWMDDFGSGYSSLDVLQSIKFELIKFDMNFMRKLDESEDGRIILSELMKMATALGVDTICEGIETENQSRFLEETGCAKLQGYYFSKPQPHEVIKQWNKNAKLNGYENPDESVYFDSICRANLFNLGVIEEEYKGVLKNTYSVLPIGVIEIHDGNSTRFLRCNQSYRDFAKHYFALDITNLGPDFVEFDAAFMKNVVQKCCVEGTSTFYDDKRPDGTVIHSFAQRISRNPVTGNDAIVVAVLSISKNE